MIKDIRELEGQELLSHIHLKSPKLLCNNREELKYWINLVKYKLPSLSIDQLLIEWYNSDELGKYPIILHIESYNSEDEGFIKRFYKNYIFETGHHNKRYYGLGDLRWLYRNILTAPNLNTVENENDFNEIEIYKNNLLKD
jgi:hypothetical protein